MCGLDIDAVCEKKLLTDFAERYILSCRRKDGKKKKEVFPNIAGFCRFCGIGTRELMRLKKEHPGLYDALCAVFEDEALNSDISATVLNTYLKKRLGYDASDEPASVICDSGGVTFVFEHDIEKDGR